MSLAFDLALGLALALAAIAPTLDAQARTYHIRSKILGEERAFHVSLPPNYAVARRRYQVVFVLDGHLKAFFDLAAAAAGYDISTGGPHEYAMPPQIVVGVEQKQRSVDLGTNQIAFDRFLAEELVPFVDKTFRTVPYRTLIGHSLGGRFALFTECRNPGMFQAVVAISPGLGDDAGLRSVIDCLRLDFVSSHAVLRQLVLTAGDREGRLYSEAVKLRDFVRDSAPPNWRSLFVDGTGLGHTDTPFTAIPAGIRFVQSAVVWEMPPAVGDSVTAMSGDAASERIAAFYRMLSARVGYPVAPSAKWLRAIAAQYLAHGQQAQGLAAAQRVTDEYPEDLGGWSVLTDACVYGGDRDCARRAIQDELRVVDRMDFFDEEGRAAQVTLLQGNLRRLEERP